MGEQDLCLGFIDYDGKIIGAEFSLFASLMDMIYPIVIKNFKLVRGIWVPPHYFAKNIM